MLKIVNVEATTLPDAWFQTLYNCVDYGRKRTIDRGSYENELFRWEMDFAVIRIKTPWIHPLIPKIEGHYNIPDPVSEEYLSDYLPYLMTGEKKHGESYTYGERISSYSTVDFKFIQEQKKDIYIQDKEILNDVIIKESLTDENLKETLLNQIELLIWTYKNKGYNNNQMVLQIAAPDDMLLKDPPCLRMVLSKIIDRKLHFYPVFRSWDLFGGFPANLAAIELLKEYCASEIGCENGEIIASSSGLHLYSNVWSIVETLRGRKFPNK